MAVFRHKAGMGNGWGLWPVLLVLLLAVLVPTGCVLWFMLCAVRNERLAVRQKLEEAYRGHLSIVQERLANHWEQKVEALEEGALSYALHTLLYPNVLKACRSLQHHPKLVLMSLGLYHFL